MRIAIVACAAIALTGCAGFNKTGRRAAGYGVVTDTKSAFDGTRVIALSPAVVAGTSGTFSTCCRVGLSWTPRAPQGAMLLAALDATVAIRSVSINIDGDIRDLAPIDDATQFGRDARIATSHKGYYVPWATVTQIHGAATAKIQIVTYSSGSVVGDLKVSDGGLFIDMLPDFIIAVEGAKRTR